MKILCQRLILLFILKVGQIFLQNHQKYLSIGVKDIGCKIIK